MQDPSKDYYKVLDVSPSATLDELKKAYRAKVMQCHPDKGGTQEQMVAVVEAWEILSDPALRAVYDNARATWTDPATRTEWEQRSQAARTKAKEHARSWKDLKRYTDSVLRDVAAAEYGEPRGAWGFPTVKGSKSAKVFMALGMVVGILLYALFVRSTRPPLPADPALYKQALQAYGETGQQQDGHNDTGPENPNGYGVLGFLIGGASLGLFVHRIWRDLLRIRAKQVMPCPSCGQKLRLPWSIKPLDVKCPPCGRSFVHTPTWEERVQRIEERRGVVRYYRNVLLSALCIAAAVCVGFFLFAYLLSRSMSFNFYP